MVATVVAFFFAVGWGFIKGANQYDVDYSVLSDFDNPQCSVVIQMPAGGQLNPGPSSADPCWDLYLYRSTSSSVAQTKDGYIEDMKSNKHRAILESIGLTLLLWALSAGAVYGAGKTVAWIILGFRRHK